MTNPDVMGYRWRVGRGVTVEVVLEGRRIVPGTHTVELRAYASRTAATLLQQVVLTRVESEGELSTWQGYVPAFDTAYALVYFEVVLVDSSSADSETISQDREEVFQEWTASVLAAPTAAPA